MIRDERQTKELNRVKKGLLVYIFLITLVGGGFKLATQVIVLERFIVELFLLVVLGIYFLLTLAQTKDYHDERQEEFQSKLASITLAVLFFGGFLFHYQSVAANYTNLFFSNSSSVYYTFGVFVFVILLRKHQVSFHGLLLEKTKKAYYFQILKRLLFFSLLFSLYLLIFYFYKIPWNFSLLAVYISLLYFWILYWLFAIYEKIQHDELLLLEINQFPNMTKNSVLFLILPTLYGFVVNYFSGQYQLAFITNAPMDEMVRLSTITALLGLLSLDMMLLSFLAYFLAYRHLQKRHIDLSLQKTMKIFLISNFVNIIVSTLLRIISIFIPLTQSPQLISTFSTISNIISMTFVVYFFVFHLLFLVALYRHQIPYRLLYAIIPFFSLLGNLSNWATMSSRSLVFFIIGIIMRFSLPVLLLVFTILHTRLRTPLHLDPLFETET